MMFRHINMPKLVAHYLREFSVRGNGTTSNLYWFVFCLCLPFVSTTFNRARLIALAIAECTESADQIFRLLEKITRATIATTAEADYMTHYSPGEDSPDFAYDGSADAPAVSFDSAENYVSLKVSLNGATKEIFESYLSLLIPFYVKIAITYE